MKTQHPRAFTLIELLVVISIISLLISILLPALASARLSAYQSKCMNNEKQIGLSLNMYMNDFNGLVTNLVYYTGGSYNDGRNSPWDTAILSYMNGNKSIYRCPIDAAERKYDPNEVKRQSYALNETSNWSTIKGTQDGTPHPDSRSPAGKKINEIINTSDVILVTCGNVTWSRKTFGSRPTVGLTTKRGAGYMNLHADALGNTTQLFMDHFGGSTYLMADNHVEHFKNEDMMGYWQGTFGNKPSRTKWFINGK
ncbi:MAG: prepilin-type N-terminal cleavage/methylation domain-containing protein [Phycisphaeraceae bacterium]|nr:prepilin-type N-terminal cleavage/methylation domain-containing protein [Phycisphaeraceae bacterium]